MHRLIRDFFSHAAWEHWVFIGIFALVLTVFFLIRKNSVYGSICLCFTVFFGLCLLDTTVLMRWCNGVKHLSRFSLAAEYQQLFHISDVRRIEMLANVVVFVPFGFFLSEFLSTTKRFASNHQIGRVALAAFGLSLGIESLQLIFRLGVFEITDLVLNTVGGLVGALISAGVRKVVGERRHLV